MKGVTTGIASIWGAAKNSGSTVEVIVSFRLTPNEPDNPDGRVRGQFFYSFG